MELVVALDPDGLSGSRADALNRQLAGDIRASRLFAVDPARAEAPTGAKSAGHDLLALVVTGVFSTATMSALRDVLVAYLERTKVRGIKVRAGDVEVEVAAGSSADLTAILDKVNASR